MKKIEIDLLEKLIAQTDGIHREMSVLSKKDPNDAVNKFKIHLINNFLKQANEFLTPKYQPLQGFETFDEALLPTNSDTTLVISQYAEALELIRADNIHCSMGTWYYDVEKEEGDEYSSVIETAPPKSLSRK